MLSKEAKDRGGDFCDASHEKGKIDESQVRLDFWAIHMTNPRAALASLVTVAFGLMEGMSSDDENDFFSSDGEGEHNV